MSQVRICRLPPSEVVFFTWKRKKSEWNEWKIISQIFPIFSFFRYWHPKGEVCISLVGKQPLIYLIIDEVKTVLCIDCFLTKDIHTPQPFSELAILSGKMRNVLILKICWKNHIIWYRVFELRASKKMRKKVNFL